jgi:hypothetical protein
VIAQGWLLRVGLPGQPMIVYPNGSMTMSLTLDSGEQHIRIGERYGGGAYTLIARRQNAPSPQPSPTAIPTAINEVELGTGDVQVTLRWRTLADLDLHVIEPSGEEIYFGEATSDTSGQLDVDANHPCNQRTTTPVENVFWPTGQSPTGTFRVRVHYHPTCGDEGETSFEVTINVTGRPPQRYAGTLSAPNTWHNTATFTN